MGKFHAGVARRRLLGEGSVFVDRRDFGGGEVRGLDYRSADKSLARPGRKKLMHVSEWREFPSAPCLAEKRKFDSSRLDVVEIARVPNTLPSLFPSWSC